MKTSLGITRGVSGLDVAMGLLVAMAMFADAASAQAAGAPIAGAAPRGAQLYLDCAACHGADGGGVVDGSVPAIGGQPAAVIAAALEDFRAARRKDLRMQHFSDPQHLAGRDEVMAVAAHVAGLRRTTAAGTGDGTRLAQGGALFARRCASCHGAAATAAVTPPRAALAGQHAAYLERKLRDGTMTTAQARRHAELARGVGDAGVAALADWLSRLPPP
jgi:cytochrome c553